MKEYIRNFDEDKLREAFRINEAYSKGQISLDMANAQMKAHVGKISPVEFAYMEQHFQEKVNDECVKENLKEMLAIYKGVLVEDEYELDKGHPIQNYLEENKAIRKVIAQIESLFSKAYIKNEWEEQFEKLNQFKVHLSRKQNQLYPALEQRGFDRPTTTMWLFDNDVRDRITELTNLVSQKFDYEKGKALFLEFKEHILDLMDKEEKILCKISLELLDDEIFREMINGDREIGYCLISPKADYENSFLEKQESKSSARSMGEFQEDLLKLLDKHNIKSNWTEKTPMDVKQGRLSLEQINLIYQHLPVDISYVDENEIVAFYSDTKHRIFPRSKGVIGRDVKNCHPANSVATVEEIIAKFRSGEKDRAEFWINKPGLFIYILYVAVRDEQGEFRGVLEMMQDCSKIRKLKSSQTLLDWGKNEDTKIKMENEEVLSEEEGKLGDKIIRLKPDTKLAKLFQAYPGLKDYMLSRSDRFSMLKSPMFKMMIKVATVEMISEKTGISIEKLQEEFTKYLHSLKEEE